jgi:hypothetical protein
LLTGQQLFFNIRKLACSSCQLLKKNAVQVTKSISEAAMKLHAKYRLARGLVNDTSFEELTGDNAENYFIKFCRCSTTLIMNPQKKTEKDASVACLSTAALCHYIGQDLIATRDLFPDHSDWQGMRKDQFPFWWRKCVLVSRRHHIGFNKPTLGRQFLARAMLFVLCIRCLIMLALI